MAVLHNRGLDADREADALVGCEEAERTEGPDGVDLTVRREMNLSRQLRIA